MAYPERTPEGASFSVHLSTLLVMALGKSFMRYCISFQVFPPSFRELPPPPLELFDLDETFSSEKARLAQITNKCEFDQFFSEFYLTTNL